VEERTRSCLFELFLPTLTTPKFPLHHSTCCDTAGVLFRPRYALKACWQGAECFCVVAQPSRTASAQPLPPLCDPVLLISFRQLSTTSNGGQREGTIECRGPMCEVSSLESHLSRRVLGKLTSSSRSAFGPSSPFVLDRCSSFAWRR
jgi:hypothetical protein